MKKIENPYLGEEGYNCFACCPTNPIGLHLEFYEDGEDVVTTWKPSTNYQGWINVLHGGIIATLIDEVSAWAINNKFKEPIVTVTSRLEIAYKKPVSVLDKFITVRAHIEKEMRGFYTIKVTLTNEAGEVCNIGTAVYYVMTMEKAKEKGFV